MKIKDLITAIRDYPILRQALEESNADLDLSRMECAQLRNRIRELEPVIDEYYQERCDQEYAVNQEVQKKAFAAFCPALDSAEKLRRFYDCVAPQYDEEGFKLFHAAQKVTGITNLEAQFPYEDACGYFEDADGHRLLRYLTAAHFQAVQWEALPGTTYERTELLDIDTSTPEYRDFERQIYAEALRDMGFQDLLPQQHLQYQKSEMRKEATRDERRTLHRCGPRLRSYENPAFQLSFRSGCL